MRTPFLDFRFFICSFEEETSFHFPTLSIFSFLSVCLSFNTLSSFLFFGFPKVPLWKLIFPDLGEERFFSPFPQLFPHFQVMHRNRKSRRGKGPNGKCKKAVIRMLRFFSLHSLCHWPLSAFFSPSLFSLFQIPLTSLL